MLVSGSQWSHAIPPSLRLHPEPHSFCLGVVRLVEQDLTPKIQTVCVVSKGRAREGQGVQDADTLAVKEELSGQGLAAE